MKLTFLLGSGVSIPARLPTVGDITNAVLSGGEIADRADGDTDQKREDSRKMLILLAWLKAQALSRYAENPERTVNYEDLAYLAGQIADDIGYEYENPAIHPFVCKALAELEGMFRNGTAGNARSQLEALANTTVTYIRRVVVSQLKKEPEKKDTRYLQFFAKACRDEDVTEVNLCTLNHDTLIDDFLRDELRMDKIEIIDGFRGADDGSRRWDHRVFDERWDDQKCVNVFKLHGSINWAGRDARHRPDKYPISWENTDRNGRFIGYYPTEKPRYGSIHAPLFLAGTFNKILNYNSGMYLDIHNRFRRALDECKTLVVCGYGFGDKGVNTRIVEWRRRTRKHRLLVIDPADSQDCYNNARDGIQQEIYPIIPAGKGCAKDVGPVKHLQKGIGKSRRPNGKQIEIVMWKEVKQRLKGSNVEFLKP